MAVSSMVSHSDYRVRFAVHRVVIWDSCADLIHFPPSKKSEQATLYTLIAAASLISPNP